MVENSRQASSGPLGVALMLLTGRISTKIIAPYLLLVFFLAVLATYVVMRLISGSLEERITNNLLDAGRIANDGIVKIEREHLQAFRLMAFTEGVDQSIEQDDAAAVRKAIEPLQVNNRIDLVDVIDARGQPILALRQDATGVRSIPPGAERIEDLAITRRVLAGESDQLGDKFSDLVSTPEGWVIYTAGPVKSVDNRLVGVILVGSRLPDAVDRLAREALASVSIYAPDGSVIQTSLPQVDPSARAGSPLNPAEYQQLMKDTSFVLVRSFEVAGRDYSELLGRMEVRRQNVTVLGVALPKTFIAQAGSATRDQMIRLFAAVIFVCLVLGLLLARRITQPIAMLVQACRRVMRGDYTVQVEAQSQDETGMLTQSFNEMVAGLRDRDRIKDTFGRYVTHEVADAILSGDVKLGGERKEVTVLMSDIRGFTTLSEMMEPEELVTFLNKYFSAMIDAVMRYGGTLDKFIGDAILAVYNAPIVYPDHATRAVKTAIEMRARLAQFNAERLRNGQQPIRIGIGINTGHVVAGNIGSEQRTEYTVIGDTVNSTQRVEDLCKDLRTDILISESTYERVKREIDCGAPHEIILRGRKQVTRVFPVLGVHGEAHVPPVDPYGDSSAPPPQSDVEPAKPLVAPVPVRRRAISRGDA